MGKEKKHSKCSFTRRKHGRCCCFNNAQYYEDVYNKTEIELIGTFNINEWKGYKKPQIFLKGMRYLPEFESYLKEATQKFEAIDNGDIDDVVMAYDIQCSRKDCIEVYRKLRTLMTKSEWAMDVFKFNAMIQDNHKDLKALIKSRLILEVFRELGLIDIIKQDIACYQIQMNKTQTVELEKSTLYNKIC